MEIQEVYKQKMSAQLKEWGAQINLLETKVESAGSAMKVKRASEILELRIKQRAAFGKMRELEIASGEAWVQIKETADKIWDDLRTGVAATHRKFM